MADEPAADGSDWRDIPEGTMPTDAQWLQRLLDSPRDQQLTFVRHVRAAAEHGWICDTFRHKEVINILRQHSIDKTHTIRRLEAFLSQEQPEAGAKAAGDVKPPHGT